MATVFVKNPILDSPFREPDRHFRLSDDGTPTEIIELTEVQDAAKAIRSYAGRLLAPSAA